MIKYFLIFVFGILETILYTWMLMAVDARQAVLSGVLMTTYMFIYLFILDKCFKDEKTIFMITIYTISCGLGTWIRVILG